MAFSSLYFIIFTIRFKYLARSTAVNWKSFVYCVHRNGIYSTILGISFFIFYVCSNQKPSPNNNWKILKMKIRRSQLEMTIMLAFENEKMTMHKCVNRMKKNAIRKTNKRNERKRMETQNWELGKYFHFKMPVTFYEKYFGEEHTQYHTHSYTTKNECIFLEKLQQFHFEFFKRMESWAQEMFVIKSKRISE